MYSPKRSLRQIFCIRESLSTVLISEGTGLPKVRSDVVLRNRKCSGMSSSSILNRCRPKRSLSYSSRSMFSASGRKTESETDSNIHTVAECAYNPMPSHVRTMSSSRDKSSVNLCVRSCATAFAGCLIDVICTNSAPICRCAHDLCPIDLCPST
jgi:hypothetical protein